MDNAIVLDGFLDGEIVPGDLHGATARFRVIVSPTDERADEMVMPCTAGDPVMAAAVLRDLHPGDQLRVTGYLRLPGMPDEPMWLAVTELELLHPAPQQSTGTGHAATAVLERYGPYVTYVDAATEHVPVWTETGTWVGVADNPIGVDDVIDAFERSTPTGDS
ncbi:hypothetical protein [Streptomyces chartreusis]|uniref:hypothetical protein n=1 Tax=Streptomyces chartreusis TaxID=1969 RepID=UPI0033CA7753